MKENESLQEMERRAYRSTLQDGFIELFCGGIFLLFTWIPVLEAIGIPRYYGYPSILFLALIPWLGKRYVSEPRLGAVEFGPKRRAKRRHTVLAALIAFVLMAPLVTMVLTSGFAGGLAWQMVALIVAPGIAIGAALVNYSRMYVYAALFLFSIAASEFPLSLQQAINQYTAFIVQRYLYH